jgi:AraC family transcriptional regulator
VNWRKQSPSRHLNIYFHRNVFDGGDEGASPLASAPTLLNANIPGIGELVEQLVAELQCPSVLNAEAADSCARLLLIHVVRHVRRMSKVLRPLTPDVVARLRDFVIAHLSERILVADLARQAGLSLNHFAFSFAEQTGQTPHRFVLGLRVERAADMLARSGASLAAIAHDCGFASQQHLCNAVRGHLGTTPSRYRAQCKR